VAAKKPGTSLELNIFTGAVLVAEDSHWEQFKTKTAHAAVLRLANKRF
jgi:hypothetical protein